ncbi:MAG TPA: glycoside hydrolase family 172 protein [Bacteroidales bacterium]|nr:glycoside hydrolase family 172 protein [Bacteroidales bacterium]
MRKLTFIFLLTGIFAFKSAFTQNLYDLPKGVQTRWASAENWKGEKGAAGILNGGRKGSPSFKLSAGTEKVLAEVNGSSGVIRRIWITINNRSPKMLRGIKIKMFWDKAKTPAVLVPLGDFFCQGLGQMKTFENVFFSSPEGRSFNCIIPMPFKTAMKIEVVNETDEDISMFFYDIDYTIGDSFSENSAYFHAWFNHQNPTEIKKDYEILPEVSGKGRYLGANIGVIADSAEYLRSWWGEGEVKIFLDGDKEFPTLCGTGTEDYIGTGWGQGGYANRYQGCTVADGAKMQYAFYRFHVPDPVYFYQDIKVTIQQIGYAGEQELQKMKQLNKTIYKTGEEMEAVIFNTDLKSLIFERADNVSSCVYFYLSQPENKLPLINK